MFVKRIRVFVVDDHPMFRAGLAAMIGAETDLVLVGEAASGADALHLVPPLAPDVVLIDVVMPEIDGIAATAILSKMLPCARFVVLNAYADSRDIDRAIEAGAAGYILKNASSQELAAVIRAAHAGIRVLGPEVTDALLASKQQTVPGADLTRRERQLLALMATGMNNSKIAGELGISLPTVKFHITSILRKLAIDSRTEAVLLALKHRLVPVL